MNRHLIFLRIICFWLFANTLAGQNIDERTNDFLGMSAARRRELVSTISKEERDSIVKELHRLLANETFSHPPVVEALAYLGDEMALQQLVQEFIANDGAGPDGLAPMQNPRLIELVAPEFYREQTMHVGGDVLIMPSSYRSAELTAKILATTPVFSAEVRQWGQNLRGIDDRELRDLIRAWWRANEKFFQEKNYSAVRPGSPPSRVLPLQTVVTVPVPGGTPIYKVVDIPAATPNPPTTEKPAPASQTPWLGYTMAGALVLLLAAALYLFTRRRE